MCQHCPPIPADPQQAERDCFIDIQTYFGAIDDAINTVDEATEEYREAGVLYHRANLLSDNLIVPDPQRAEPFKKYFHTSNIDEYKALFGHLDTLINKMVDARTRLPKGRFRNSKQIWHKVYREFIPLINDIESKIQNFAEEMVALNHAVRVLCAESESRFVGSRLYACTFGHPDVVPKSLQELDHWGVLRAWAASLPETVVWTRIGRLLDVTAWKMVRQSDDATEGKGVVADGAESPEEGEVFEEIELDLRRVSLATTELDDDEEMPELVRFPADGW